MHRARIHKHARRRGPFNIGVHGADRSSRRVRARKSSAAAHWKYVPVARIAVHFRQCIAVVVVVVV